MDKKTKWIAGGAIGFAVLAGGTGIGLAASGDDDQPLKGTALDQAVAAALAETGGGTVIETEAGDDGAAYGVEIRLDDGGVVEVNLDQNFQVIGQEADDDGSGDDGSADD